MRYTGFEACNECPGAWGEGAGRISRQRPTRMTASASLPRRSPERVALARLLAEWPPERLRAVLEGALESWDADFLRHVIRLRWNARLRTTVGRAMLEEMVVELNPRLLARHPEEIRPVLVHEAAHLVVHRLHGYQPDHGKVWKAYMRRAGESTRATHELDVRGLRNRRRRRA